MWIERGEVKKGSGVEPSATVLGLGSIQLGKCSNLTSDFSLQKATELCDSSGNLADHRELVPRSCIWTESS